MSTTQPTSPAPNSVARSRKGLSRDRLAWVRRNPGRAAGIALAGILAGISLLPLFLGPPIADFSAAYQPPNPAAWFGTDSAGRSLGILTAYGLQTSLIIAVTCAVASTVLGVLIGTTAAAVGGRADELLMRSTDAVNALPHLLLGIVIVALFRGSITAIIASIALTHWPAVARIVRARARTAMTSGYITDAYLAGASHGWVARQHLFPAVAPQAATATVLLLPHAVWHESTLSFLGLGLSPDQPSLGVLLSQAQGALLLGAWWTLVVPAAALAATALSAHLIAGRRS